MPNKPGPKSAAELSVAPVIDVRHAKERPVPLEGLSEPERAIWQRITAAMPANWFNREHLDLLARYCQHQARAHTFSRMASHFKPSEIGETITLDDLDRICRMAERESRAALALARSMRFTHQSQLHTETAARKRNQQAGYIPDEFNGGEPRKPWEPVA